MYTSVCIQVSTQVHLLMPQSLMCVPVQISVQYIRTVTSINLGTQTKHTHTHIFVYTVDVHSYGQPYVHTDTGQPIVHATHTY